MLLRAAFAALLLCLSACARAEDAQPASPAAQAAAALPFDYWLLSLSWSPQYCRDHVGDPQCLRPYAFVVHGLWPQNEVGYPKDCGRSDLVSQKWLKRMLPIMPSAKLIQHEWRKHGVCSTMSMDEYFMTVERSYRNIAIPLIYQEPKEYINTTAEEIQRNFLAVNPGLTADRIALQCSGRFLKEVRVCYDKNFQFRSCGSDIEDRCRDQITLRSTR
ncbi:ribonuclease T2 family protein [Stenotrophobium rhamnosiphilum]|uniref:Ribonuclease T(2) n=1 Tax=Stenotrophobium rhamnosiphilum TaxID=2029166 RepID=A0A2T5MHM0_9GAMM|nr:ribonuclease T2 [Stenotrophobium rhamnosiphilum]PTU32082.1 ribonuclease T(2) [Stenotrophobium rhamnosiphilum]